MLKLEDFINNQWPHVATFSRDHLFQFGLSDLALSMFEYQLQNGGKKIRSFIATNLSEIYGSSATQSIPLAAAIELTHNASLIHDDVQDGDEWRRAHESLWKVYSTEQAINAGDMLFSLAVDMCFALKISPEKKLQITKLLNASVVYITDGQVLDIEQDKNRPSLETYLHMIDRKTGGLFELSFLSGAMLGPDFDMANAKAMQEIGRNFGRIFQIRDDLIDILGNKEGRKRGADIREGKISLPVLLALEAFPDKEKKILLDILVLDKAQTTQQHIDTVLNLYERFKIYEKTFDLYLEYKNNCLKNNLQNERLNDFIAYLLSLLEIKK